jgi:hypothetical protein
MRRWLIFVAVAVAGLAWLGGCKETERGGGASARGPNERFYLVQDKLDPGGSFYLYVDLKDMFRNLAETADTLLTQAREAMPPDEQAVMEHARNVVRVVFETSSLFQVEDVGMSVIPDGDLNRCRVYVRMPEEASGLRTVLGGEPSTRQLLHFAPENTILYYDTDFSFARLFGVVREAYREAAPPEVAGEFDRGLEGAEAASGFPIRDVLNALDGQIGVMITADDSAPVLLPNPQGQPLQIPKPAILLALESKDSILYDAAKQTLANAGVGSVAPVELPGGVEGSSLASPLAFFGITPTFAQAEGFFVMSTDPSLLAPALERLQAGKGGLAAAPEFADAMKDLPRTNNGTSFVSARVGEIYLNMIKQSGDPVGQALVSSMETEPQPFAGVRVNEPDGIMLILRTQSSGSEIVAAGLVAPAGVMVAIAVPGFLRAREVSRMRSCQENLAKIDGAKMQWALDNTKPGDAVPTWDDLVKSDGTGYLRAMPVCPSGGTYTIGAVDELPRCSHDQGQFPHVFPGQ